MHKTELSKRIHQLGALSRRALSEAEDGRVEEVQCLWQESLPRIKSIYNELKPYIDAQKAYDTALEGSMKPRIGK